MQSSLFGRIFLFSLTAHIIVFSAFTLSFNKVPEAISGYPSIYFIGSLLPASCVNPNVPQAMPPPDKLSPLNRIKVLNNIEGWNALGGHYLKPSSLMPLALEKEVFSEPSLALPSFLKKRQPTIVFHPVLPYSFTLYFKDRQMAHVELMFKIIPESGRSSAVIKRKISSGNLEVDLLCKRYMGHYLFIQKARFTPDIWQSVKIELSAKDD